MKTLSDLRYAQIKTTVKNLIALRNDDARIDYIIAKLSVKLVNHDAKTSSKKYDDYLAFQLSRLHA